MSSRWLSVRLETIGNLIILFASLFAVLARDTMDPGKVGLSLSYALNVTGAMNLLVSKRLFYGHSDLDGSQFLHRNYKNSSSKNFFA